jgi:hypothetical protein
MDFDLSGLLCPGLEFQKGFAGQSSHDDCDYAGEIEESLRKKVQKK